MRNILSIFKADIKALSRQFFAMAIIIAITIIPALYAWLNIFANWDPYGNTGNIKIACASDDVGWTDLEGKHVNMGDTVLQSLAEKDSINFIVYEDSDRAIAAAEAGECYGAIVLHKNFTRNMYDIGSAIQNSESTITFYENYKLNAVADKISETAASTVNQSIQEQYLEVVFDTVFSKIGDALENVDAEDTGNKAIDFLYRIRSSLAAVDSSLEKFSDNSTSLAAKLANVSTGNVSDRLGDAGTHVQNVDNGIEYLRTKYKTDIVPAVNSTIDELLAALGGLPALGTADADAAAAAYDSIIRSSQNLQSLGNDIYAVSPAYGQQIIDAGSSIETMALAASGGTAPPEEQLLYMLKDDLTNLKSLNVSIDKTIDTYFNMLSDLTENLAPVINSLSLTVDSIDPTMRSAADTIYALDGTLVYLRTALAELVKTMDNLIKKAESVRDGDITETVSTMFGGDSGDFAEFFACPVTVRTEVLYPVADYGTAMTPFYSTLAIWVGCVVLAAILKIEAEPRRLRNVTETEIFFARFLLFLILNEIQTAIILAGDILLLGVTCKHAGWFFFAGAVTSFAFTCLIYSLVIAFRDIGKAIVVVVMVLQIAGSGGTYPIEILEKIFSSLYLLFPFPYGIEAMREAICGFYGHDYAVNLLKLMLFAVGGLLIGLFVRKPFIKINEYVEEEMSETGVL